MQQYNTTCNNTILMISFGSNWSLLQCTVNNTSKYNTTCNNTILMQQYNTTCNNTILMQQYNTTCNNTILMQQYNTNATIQYYMQQYNTKIHSFIPYMFALFQKTEYSHMLRSTRNRNQGTRITCGIIWYCLDDDIGHAVLTLALWWLSYTCSIIAYLLSDDDLAYVVLFDTFSLVIIRWGLKHVAIISVIL